MNRIDIYTNGYYCRPNFLWLRRKLANLYFNQIIRNVSISQGYHVLEIGCDQGELTELLKKCSCSVIGVDCNSKAIKKSGKLFLQVMDARNLEFPDCSFDLVVTVHTIEHIPEIQKVVSEIERVVRPGGLVVLIYPWEPVRGCTTLPEALLMYKSLKVCRQLHVHNFTPRKINRLIEGTTLYQRNRRFFFGPHPMFISVLRKWSG